MYKTPYKTPTSLGTLRTFLEALVGGEGEVHLLLLELEVRAHLLYLQLRREVLRRRQILRQGQEGGRASVYPWSGQHPVAGVRSEGGGDKGDNTPPLAIRSNV